MQTISFLESPIQYASQLFGLGVFHNLHGRYLDGVAFSLYWLGFVIFRGSNPTHLAFLPAFLRGQVYPGTVKAFHGANLAWGGLGRGDNANLWVSVDLRIIDQFNSSFLDDPRWHPITVWKAFLEIHRGINWLWLDYVLFWRLVLSFCLLGGWLGNAAGNWLVILINKVKCRFFVRTCIFVHLKLLRLSLLLPIFEQSSAIALYTDKISINDWVCSLDIVTWDQIAIVGS